MVEERVYLIAEEIAKEIEKRGVMNFEEIDQMILELSNESEDKLYESDFKNDIYTCLNYSGIATNYSTGDFYTLEYARQNKSVAEE